MASNALVVGLGELLWDMLPGGKQLGGAPANFAYISGLLGNRATVVSRVGSDPLGREALDRVRDLGLDISHVQPDLLHPTGTVDVTVDANGHPEFVIHENVAWDYLEWTSDLERLAAEADVVCFGSLAQRNEPSRSTIQKFLRATRSRCLRIFDVNLRQSFYAPAILKASFAAASVAKVNDEELPIVMKICGLPVDEDDDLANARRLREELGLDLLCVTRGPRGSLLVTAKGESRHSGFRVKVADTVGSGDAFTAAMAHFYRLGASLDRINQAANRMGAWVASQPGATPRAAQGEIAKLLNLETWTEA